MTYFDWNATAPVLPAAREAWLEVAEQAWGNPSALYREGTKAKAILDSARAAIAEALKVDASRIVFTSGATESNNAFLRIAKARSSPGGCVWISSVEHPSVREASLHYWGQEVVLRMPVTSQGALDVDWFTSELNRNRPALVCLMAVNNETGVIQPLEHVAGICRERGIPLFCDAVQWPGKVPGPLEPTPGGISFSLSAHKFGGLKGTGCLVLAEEWLGSQLQFGGGQESGARAGTEDVAGIAAMAAALTQRIRQVDASMQEARDRFEEKLTGLWPAAVIHGKAAPRAWNTCSVSLPDFPAHRWVSRLDKKGFAVASGAACSSAKKGPSATMRAMGVDDRVAGQTIRISAGWETVPEQWECLLQAIREVHGELAGMKAQSSPGTVIEL